MTTTQQAELLKELNGLLEPHPQAKAWALLYTNYVHMIDDLIDEKITDPERILEVFAVSASVFSHPFYIENMAFLYPVEVMVNNTYADSVAWETKGNNWQKRDAMSLRHCGIDMFLMVLRITVGREELRKISPKFRAYSHFKHLGDFPHESEETTNNNSNNGDQVQFTWDTGTR